MSKPLATKCQANFYGTNCKNTTTNPTGLCHQHTGMTGPNRFTPLPKGERFPKPVYAAQNKDIVDENTGLITPKQMLQKSLSMIAEGVLTLDPVKMGAGLISSGPAGSAIFDKWRVEEGIDIGTNPYLRPLSVPLPNFTKESEGSFLPYEFNRDYKKDLSASAKRAEAIRSERRIFPSHLVRSTLEAQCNHLHSRIIQLNNEDNHLGASVLMDHMSQFAKLAAEHDPATAADKKADDLMNMPKMEEPKLKNNVQYALMNLPFQSFLENIVKRIPLTTEPAINEDEREALNEVIKLYRDTARRLRSMAADERQQLSP